MASIPVLVFSIEKKNAFALPPDLSKFFILQSLSWTKEFAHGYLQEVLHLAVCVNVMLMVFVDFMQKTHTHPAILSLGIWKGKINSSSIYVIRKPGDHSI